jgi:hypothetical protein
VETPTGENRVPLAIRRSCLRRAQPRRARLIRQAYEVDPLLCPRCGKPMRVIAVIEQPAVIQRILNHLGLPIGAARLRAPPDLPGRGTPAGPPDGTGVDQPREWSYEPFFDDLPAADVADPVVA